MEEEYLSTNTERNGKIWTLYEKVFFSGNIDY